MRSLSPELASSALDAAPDAIIIIDASGTHVDFNDPSACGRALRDGERVIIEDVEEDAAYQPHRAIAAQEGCRAVQSTPIRGAC